MRPTVNHRPAILETAARLFASKPYHEVLMDDVAAKTGLSKGSLYRFYPDKRELYVAIVMEWLATLAEEVREAARSNRPCRERLREMVRRVADHFDARRDSFEVMRREEHNPHICQRPEFLRRRGAIRDAFAEVIRDGQSSGDFRCVDANVSADMLLGMIRSLMRFGSRDLSPKTVAEMVLDVFLNGLNDTHPRARRR